MPYVVIARANRLIQAAESGNLTDAAEAKATIDQYDAEAKVLRLGFSVDSSGEVAMGTPSELP